LRPTTRTVRDMIAPEVQRIFTTTGGAIPLPLASVFIRNGDKDTETKVYGAEEHMRLLHPIASSLGIHHVYVGSDDFAHIATAVDRYRDQYSMYFLDYHRESGGLKMTDVEQSSRSWKIIRQVRVSLADLYVSAISNVSVGILGSNWCMLSGELQRASGRPHLDYGDLDRLRVLLDSPT
jgi:hypothetical protein